MNEPNLHPLADAVGDAAGLGRRRFLQAAGAVAGAAAVAQVLPSGAVHGAAPAGATRFVPLPKAVRLADTRYPDRHYPYEQIADRQIRVQVRDRAGVPREATAVVLTVTAKNRQTINNYVTVFPTDSPGIPTASNLNLPRPNEVTANLAFVRVGGQNAVDVFQMEPCEFSIVDVLGYFVPVPDEAKGGRFVSLPAAWRALDTRPGFVGAGTFTTVDLTNRVPSDAASVVINLTSVANVGGGWFSAVPYSVTSEPETSSLNVFFPNDKRAAAVIVPVETVDGRRLVKIYAATAAKLIVDVTGYFTSESSGSSSVGLFVPTDPTRVLDTRIPDPAKRLWPGWVVERALPSPADNGAAVVLNVTSVRTRSEGYLTVSAARRDQPATSNVNWNGPNAIVPNLVITPVTTTYGFQAFTSSGGHVTADMAGYFTGSPLPVKYLNPPVNPPIPPVGPEWTLRIPRIGLTSRVLEGNSISITNAGHSWYWTGTGLMGQAAHVAVFGHRTEAGGPYRYLHLLQPGDTWTVTTFDGREFTYRMVRRDLTDAQTQNILNATRFHPGTTFSMVACTVGYDRTKSAYPDAWAPTSLKYRIVVTGELVSWREV